MFYLKLKFLWISVAIFIAQINFTLSVNRISTGIIAEYPFYRSECLNPNNSFIDTTNRKIFPILLSNGNNICLRSNGLYSCNKHYLVSAQNISKAVSSIQGNSFAIEFWTQLNKNINKTSTIFSMYNSLSSSVCKSSLQVDQIPSSDHDLNFNIINCVRSRSLTFPVNINAAYNDSDIVHIVFNFQYNNIVKMLFVDITINVKGISYYGSNNSTLSQNNGVTSWDLASKLYLFSDPLLTTPLIGKVYYFAFYEHILNSSQISTNYNAKLPPSPTFVAPMTVHIQENGEVGNHSQDPSFYSRPILATQLPIISLEGYNFDNTPESPNYNPFGLSTMSFEIVSNVSIGVLYFENGIEITKFPATIHRNGSTGLYNVRYRPPYDKFNIDFTTPLASFYIQANDSNELSANAIVSIFVSHVPKPPVVSPQNQFFSIYANQFASITVSGVDIDSPIKSMIIDSLPQLGNLSVLHKVNQSFIKLTNTIISGTTLSYLYNGPQVSLNPEFALNGILAKDSFQFRLIDASGRKSVPGYANITIQTSLVALPNTINYHSKITNAIEGLCSLIKLHGMDLSSINQRTLSIEITKSPYFGKLYSKSTCSFSDLLPTINSTFTSYLLNGTIRPNEYQTKGLSVYYLGEPYYFSYPYAKFNGSFIPTVMDEIQYRVHSLSDKSVSTNGVQNVNVKNVNHPTNISFQFQDPWIHGITIYAKSGLVSKAYQTKAVITGFGIVDVDKDVDLVRVVINTKHGGYFSMNPSYVDRLDYTSVDCFNSRWGCEGSGFEDIASSFLAMPSDVNLALNGMSYESVLEDLVDVINITIYDGIGGQCLDTSVLSTGSIYNGCFKSNVLIPVTVLSFAGISTSTFIQSNLSANDFSSRLTVIMYVLMGLMVLLCVVYGCRRYLRCKRLKKKQDDNLKLKDIGRSTWFSRRRNSQKHSLDTPSDGNGDNIDDFGTSCSAAADTNPDSPQQVETTPEDVEITIRRNEVSNTNIPQNKSKKKKSSKENKFAIKKLNSNDESGIQVSVVSPSTSDVKPIAQSSQAITTKEFEEHGDWKSYLSKDGRTYYYNKSTKQSTWRKPEGFP